MVEAIIEKYQMQSHPEGGYFSETYRSEISTDFPSFLGPRSVSTAIYFLLRSGEKSHLHRIKSDEVWHFYLGDSLTIFEITPKGQVIQTSLGQDFQKGDLFQYTVKAGHWFGAFLEGEPQQGFSFVGCTVAPGFDFQDFELANYDELADSFPQHASRIKQLCISS